MTDTPGISSAVVTAILDTPSIANNATDSKNLESSVPTWGWWVLQFGTPLLLILGIPGNILVLVVMKSPRFRSKSYSHYLCTLAVFDCLVLCLKYFKRLDELVEYTSGTAITSSFGDAACRIHNFCEHVCYLMSSWIVLCMSIERFIAVNFPFKKDLYCKPRSAVIIILIVFTILFCSQIFRFVMYGKNEVRDTCMASTRHLYIYLIIHVYVYQLMLQFTIPALLTLMCNMSILWKIRQLRHKVIEHGSNHSARANLNRHKTTCTLLLVSFTYILTVLPLLLLSIVIYVAIFIDKAAARILFSKCENLKLVLELFSEVNYCANFYIYVMSGSQFRGELHSMLFRQRSFISSGGPTERLQVFNFRRSMTAV